MITNDSGKPNDKSTTTLGVFKTKGEAKRFVNQQQKRYGYINDDMRNPFYYIEEVDLNPVLPKRTKRVFVSGRAIKLNESNSLQLKSTKYREIRNGDINKENIVMKEEYEIEVIYFKLIIETKDTDDYRNYIKHIENSILDRITEYLEWR